MSLKNRINKNEITYGTWITINSPIIPEILASAGFDWLCIDLEHSSIDLDDLMSLIISIERNNIYPLVRVGENNSNLIKRVMDLGSHGVIVPNVNNEQDAIQAVRSVKYPPYGNRGVGLFRAQKFGKKFDEYLSWVKKNSIVIVQIEHIDAVNNLEKIFSVKGIDAYFIGPYDLSSSMGIPGKFKDKRFKETLNKIIETGKKFNISSGFHSVSSNAKEAIKYKRLGFKLIALSLDSIFLGDKAVESLSKLKKSL